VRTPEDIASTEALQSCRRCDCEGRCKRLLGMIRDARSEVITELAQSFLTVVVPIHRHLRDLRAQLSDALWDNSDRDLIARLSREIAETEKQIAKGEDWHIPF
jgi:hypothetical protein